MLSCEQFLFTNEIDTINFIFNDRFCNPCCTNLYSNVLGTTSASTQQFLTLVPRVTLYRFFKIRVCCFASWYLVEPDLVILLRCFVDPPPVYFYDRLTIFQLTLSYIIYVHFLIGSLPRNLVDRCPSWYQQCQLKYDQIHLRS